MVRDGGRQSALLSRALVQAKQTRGKMLDGDSLFPHFVSAKPTARSVQRCMQL